MKLPMFVPRLAFVSYGESLLYASFQTFDEWNKGTLDSFLIQITAEILRFKENGKHTVDLIRDSAGQVRFSRV